MYRINKKTTSNNVDMKKVIIAAALLLGAGSTVTINANTGIMTEIQTPATESWLAVEAEALPQPVKDALANQYAGQTVSEAFVKEAEGVKTYKVVLTNAEGTKTEVLFNEKGEVVNPQ